MWFMERFIKLSCSYRLNLFFEMKGVSQLVAALSSGLEILGSILIDPNVCFDFPLIYVALALNTCKMEYWQREGVKGTRLASSFMNWRKYQH